MKPLLTVSLLALTLLSEVATATDVGVFYYPGWYRPNIDGWEKIKPHPDREPFLGWYKEGSDDITRTQIRWMEKYGINFIAYDWYWDKGTGIKNRTYAIDSFVRSSTQSTVEFSLLWANHTETPESYEQYDEIVNYWIEHYFKQKNYKKINGKPVVFIFSAEMLLKDSRKFGATPKELLKRARSMAKKAGLKGIYFVGSAGADKISITQELPDQTYDALSAYNYQHSASPNLADRKLSKSYQELSEGYFQNWNFILDNSKLPYIVPITSGWDKTPWGGSSDPLHDQSSSTPEQFAEHLKQAKQLVSKNPEKSLNTVIICCWNEFGEGSYIEPTKKFGFKYLEQIKRILK